MTTPDDDTDVYVWAQVAAMPPRTPTSLRGRFL